MMTKLSDVVIYPSGKIRCEDLTPHNYVGTDNILQNKAGKMNSVYVPKNGFADHYKRGDILIANIRPYLKKIWFANNEGGCSPDVSLLRVDSDDVIPEFVYYNLLQDVFFEFAMKGSKGSKMPRLDKRHIMDFPIADFNKHEQSKIVKILSLIDEKIALNNRIIETIQKTIYEVFDFWFLQYEFPDQSSNPYKSTGGKFILNVVLGSEIPDGWEVHKVADLLKKVRNSSNKVDSDKIYTSGKYPVITQDTGELITGYTDIDKPIERLPVIVFGDHSCTLRYVTFPFFQGADGTQLMYFDEQLMNYMFVFLSKIIPKIPGYGKYERHYKYIKDLTVIVPDSVTLRGFNSAIDPLLSTSNNKYMENKQLENLRDWLIPILLSRRVQVSE